MPIIFIGEASAIATNNTEQPFDIRFRVLDRYQVPQVGVTFRGLLRYNNMEFLIPPVGSTDQNGEGVIRLRAIPATGSFDLLSVATFIPGQYERGSIPVVLYDPNSEPEISVDKGWVSNNGFAVYARDVNAYGLRIHTTLPGTLLPTKNAFIIIDAFYQTRISLTPTSTITFYLPPSINGAHLLNVGRYRVFYGLNKASSNIYVPHFFNLEIIGDEVGVRLLPLVLITRGGPYIDALDNAICIFPIIPGNQASIDIGDRWQAFYSTVEPIGPNPDFILMAQGTVESNAAIQFSTTPNFFPRVRNVPVWLWYSITKSDGRLLTSTPIIRILDTL